MSSSHAARFNTAARPRLASIHGDTYTHNYTDSNNASATHQLAGTFKRVKPTGQTVSDGVGVTSYTGEAMFTCATADLPSGYKKAGDLIVDGVTWSIVFVETVDAWNSMLHLAKPTADDFRPGRITRR